MIRQLMSVLISFLIDKAFAALFCLQTIMNFVRLAIYNSHIEEILNYMQATLHNIDRLKMIFKNSRPTNKKTERKHFNFSKFHVMTHYVDSIREFESAVEINSFYEKSAYKFTIKNFYTRTNRQFNFNEQILLHNIRRQNILAMNDALLYARSKTITSIDKQDVIEINSISRDSIKLRD